MSKWVHTTGCFRFNNSRHYIFEIEDVLGEIVENDSCYTTLPYGTEGSLNYEVIKNSDNDKYIVPFWGDLRDCENGTKKILEWFYTVCSELNPRQASITIFEDGIITNSHYNG